VTNCHISLLQSYFCLQYTKHVQNKFIMCYTLL